MSNFGKLKQFFEHGYFFNLYEEQYVLDSIVVSIPACHAGDRGSIPRRGGNFFLLLSNK